MDNQNIIIREATATDKVYSKTITDEMANSAAARGTGIAKRTPEYIEQKIDEGKAVIAISGLNEWVGFCYIETWSHGEYVANSGLIVAPAFRKGGVAKAIKKKIFELKPQTLSRCQNIRSHHRACGNENKQRSRVRTGYLFRTYTRRSFLGRLQKLCKL